MRHRAQVEAMLLVAAERTSGLLKEPAPFVLQTSLGDFAVSYELNAYCNDPRAMGRLYTAMHQNVLDIFNEHGVQIMTPTYEGDPGVPKGRSQGAGTRCWQSRSNASVSRNLIPVCVIGYLHGAFSNVRSF